MTPDRAVSLVPERSETASVGRPAAVGGAAGGATRSVRPAALPSLTGLRWGAALMVFLYHVNIAQYFGGRVGDLVGFAFGAGDTGVSFFFILSGFVLAWSTPPGGGVAGFWRRRFARVYPLHAVTAVIALLLAYFLGAGAWPLHRQLLVNLFLVQSWVPRYPYFESVNSVSWSLACEAFFYFLFPLVVRPLRALGQRGGAVVAAACTAVVVAMPVLIGHLAPAADRNWAVYYLPLARLPEFLLGIALAELVRAGRWRGPGLTVSLGLTMAGYFLSSQADWAYRYAACTVVGFTALIAAAATADLRGEPSPWRGRLSVRLGELSFAFYMVHILVVRTGEQLFRSHPKEPWWPNGLLLAETAFTAALAVAWTLHTFIEVPGRRLLLRRWGGGRAAS
ncbi:acyltransferase family protein [Kitasatospora sp. HPMI-4]|uniref:acyltransferase family protein n=1 Tax=Kitasatospora sp. HPMI-4 TaxID=3448443 RepID=UPI003F1BCBAE